MVKKLTHPSPLLSQTVLFPAIIADLGRGIRAHDEDVTKEYQEECSTCGSKPCRLIVCEWKSNKALMERG